MRQNGPVLRIDGRALRDAASLFRAFAQAAVHRLLRPQLPPPPRHTVRRIEAVFDRPFGFLAVHRVARLVLTAGSVAEPALPKGREYDVTYADEGDMHGRRERHGPDGVQTAACRSGGTAHTGDMA
ncbi:hypothetical protein [Streptomyces sp. NPDC053427]|uniref:hypothetical protein n=1 Tax=Streptomyces sp. NPDC053427 TaxID=3365701 RepID=UPI0037D02A9C